MSEARLVVRLRKSTDALERVIGLVRRRAFTLRRFSVAEAGADVVEVCLRIDESRTPRERVRVELEKLVDVLGVQDATGEDGTSATRELLLARLHPEHAEATRRGTLVELTGSPDEVDAELARLRAGGALKHFVRSGEVRLP